MTNETDAHHSDNSIIAMHSVSKFYASFQALSNVSINVGLGERVVVCGPSGSGKSEQALHHFHGLVLDAYNRANPTDNQT